MGGYLGQVLVKLGLVSEQDLAQALSDQLDIPLVPAAAYPEELLLMEGLSREFLYNNLVVPLSLQADVCHFAAATPQDPFVAKALSLATGREVVLALGLESDIAATLQRYEAGAEEEVDDEAAAELAGGDEFVEHLRDLASEAPVIRLVNQIIHRALDLGASDIHIEPFDDGLHLRYRVDGIIQDVNDPPPAAMGAAIASRIKLLAHLNIAERRLPQDGRIMTRVKGHELDLRVSTVPTVHGESIVMRVLDRQNIRFSLESMGFSPDILEAYTTLLHRPHGVLLLTGPTGSGKTTTLYTTLKQLATPEVNVCT
ncbi:MAG TPA: Flp pilus assembly complex ATPase component TadA, partial [Pseudomonadaceae bacterium]|nr:Flp pilus assembly complex ATPase component TadA [Pseudomonadaceae bacterium]